MAKAAATWHLPQMANRNGLLAATALAVMLLRCSAISVASDPTGAAGESCTKKADCATGLSCVGNLCTAPADGTPDAETPVEGGPDEGTPATQTGCEGATCDPTWSGNGTCERECNCAELSYDGGECANGCTDEANRAVWDVAGFELQPGDCWQGCAGDPELTTCTDTCLQGVGLSAACSTCFAIFVDCLGTNCDATCVDEPARADCETCSNANCWLSFYTCSGAIGTPR